GEQTLARLPEIDLDELRKIIEMLAEYETTVSSRRRSIQEVMDKIQAEIVRRYTSGETDPTAALS
ncbi:MAG TPA: aerial mycelium formation protein, partial [Actinomycetota bacterium]|nr:aerial mycelium formation protein [Actinomycetota bacterium]